MLEITITHRFDALGVDRLRRDEALDLRSNRWIGLGTEGYGPDPARYRAGRHRSQIVLFNRIASEGAAVVAAYPALSLEHDRFRVVGIVRPTTIEKFGRLIYLPLTDARVYDASISFLGNLPPMQSTVQDCRNRAQTRLAALALHQQLPRSSASMHHKDVEWCCLNYMIARRECEAVWRGGHAFPGIDHVAWAADGQEILVQTTVSNDPLLVKEKSSTLAALASAERRLVMFAPAETRTSCEASVQFVSIEEAFESLDQSPSGRKFIDRALWMEPIDPPPS
jgi:hypothetical protein